MVCVKSQRYKIDELAKLVHPRDGHPKIFAMIEAYLDESGIHAGAPVCVIAGYFGRHSQWKLLERGWRKVLSEFNFRLEDFHAKTLLKATRHHEMLVALAKTIAKYQIYPMSAGVVVDDFKALTIDQRRFLTGAKLDKGKLVGSGAPSKPYFAPFQLCLETITKHTKPGERAHFFFGLDRPFAEYARLMFTTIKTDKLSQWNLHRRLGDPSFPMASETPELQAADLLVHATYLHLIERYNTGSFLAPPVGLLAICLKNAKSKLDHYYQDGECLLKTIEKAHEIGGTRWDKHFESTRPST